MHRNNIRFLIVNIFVILLICQSANGQHQLSKENADEVKTLSFGQVFEREIVPMQKHRYAISLEAGQFIKFEIEETDVDAVMSFRSPDNTNLFEYAEVKPVNNVKTNWAAVADKGVYELRVISYGAIKGKGIYRVKISEIRPANDEELNFTGGMKLFNEAFNGVNPALSTTEVLQTSIVKGEQALEKFRLAKAVKNEARTLWQMAVASSRLGRNAQVIELFQASIEKFRSINDRRGVANVLRDLGNSCAKIGEWDLAIQNFSESLKIARAEKLEMVEAGVLNQLGEMYANFGDFERAALYYQQSSEIYLQYSNMSRSIPLNNLGKVSLNNGEAEKASEYFRQAVETVRKEENRFGTTKAQEAEYLNNLGRAQFALGKRDKAIETFNESLKISRETTNKSAQSASLKFLGQISLDAGETDKSLEFFNQSLDILRAVEDSQNKAEIFLFLSKAEAAKNNVEMAQNHVEEAIELIEKTRSGVRTANLRDSFSANLQDYYAFYIELLMTRHKLASDKNFAALALQANERARARGLLNLLTESNADIRQGADPKLLEREISVKNLLAARLENLTKVLNGKSDAEQTLKLKNEIEQIRAEHEQIQAQIRTASPRYAALTQPKTLTLAEIQKDVLDADSVLLEYALGETKSYLWIVTKNSFQTIELPKREKIETSAKQVYEALTARNKRVKFETADERRDRIEFADADFIVHSKDLSRMIIAPTAALSGKKRLLVVADGALQYIPFAALLNGEKYLIETNEIVNLPSASALAVLRRELNGRPISTKTLAVLADPIFEKDDERFATMPNKDKAKPQFQAVAARNPTREGLELSRLPFTRREADLVSSLVPSNQQTKRLDFEANRQFVLSTELSDYRYMHFATHGFINSKTPELSGIVLSLFDESGAEQDGFLRVGDIYNLKLNAEMVVLSGCRTGLGKEIKGEGLIGLTRGFMYAGARRVAVSLWDVNDEATADLMGKLYREMLGAKKLSSAASLRQAQISMIRDKNWSNPYYWSAFILQGEPK